MALDATNFVQKGHLKHVDVGQFYDLLTGVMTDQPVHIANDVTVASMTVGGTLAVYGGPSTFMFGASMSSGAWTGNGTVPPGGASGQVLSKSAAGDYALAWTTPSPGITLPLSQHLTFSPDNTYDLGATSTTLRPRTVYAATSVVAGSGANATTIGAASGNYVQGGSLSFLTFGTNGTPRWNIDANGSLGGFSDNTVDIGQTASRRPRTVYAATSFIGPGAVPPGGATNQVLSKSGAGDYSVAWTTPATGVSWPLLAPDGTAGAPSYSFANATATGMFSSSGVLTLVSASTINIQAAATFNIQFWTGGSTRWRVDSVGMFQAGSDNAYDIGATASGRPRDVFVARNLTVAGTGQFTGNVGIGTAPVTYSGLMFQPTMSGANQFALYAPLTFSTTGTGNTFVFYTLPTYAASTRTVAAGASFYADTPTLGAGVTVTGMYGLFVGNQGRSGVTKAYGIYVNPISGATNNFAIQTNGPVNVFGGRTNFGGTDQGDQHYFILFATTPPPTSGFGGMTFSDQTGLRIEYWSNSLCTGSVTGLFAAVLGGNTSKTAVANGIQIGNPGNQGAGIGTSTGLRIDNVVSGSDNNYEMWLGTPSGATGDNKSIVFGNANEYIRNPKNAANNLSIESSDGYVMVSSAQATNAISNGYWDGTNYQRYSTASGWGIWSVGPASVSYYAGAAGANPIALGAAAMTVTSTGDLTVNTVMSKSYLYLTDGNSYLVRSGADVYIRSAGTFFVQDNGGGYTNLLSTGKLSTNTYLLLTGFNGVSGAISGLIYYHPNFTVYSYLDGGNGYHYANLTLVATGFTPTSARKLKTNIRLLADPLDVVLDDRVHAVRYTEIASGASKVGFVADDWVDVEPTVVRFDNDEVAALDYDRISAVTFEALKQHVIQTNARLDALEAKLAA